jgi:hypothetical protein
MLTLADVRKALTGLNLTKVSKLSGVKYDRIWRLVNKPKGAPSYQTVAKLSAWIKKTPDKKLKLLKWRA